MLKNGFTRMILALSLTSQAPQVFAFEICNNNFGAEMHDVGFFLSSNEVEILKKAKPQNKNKDIGQSQAKEKIEKSISRTRPELSGISNSNLAGLIAKASFAVGIDFQMLSSIVKKESLYCKLRHNKIGGDSGCTQFTSAALKELKHQFSGDSKLRAAAVPSIMKGFVSKYFAGQPEREKKFYSWLGSDYSNMKAAMRTTNYDIDVLAGALLLKFYLAVNDGNYYRALVQYNGNNSMHKKSKKRFKYLYADTVQAYSQLISIDNSVCLEAVSKTNELINDTCSLEENPDDCFITDESFAPPLGSNIQNI